MLFTLAVCLICWIICYAYSSGFPSDQAGVATPLWMLADRLFDSRPVAFLAGLSVAVITACIIQYISNMEMLMRERTRLPFMLFLLLISTNAGLLPLKTFSFVLLCLVFTVCELIALGQSSAALGRFFQTGMLIAFAGLFLPQAVLFLPLVWIGMYQLRSLNLNNFLASLIGALIVGWMVAGWCMWMHDFSMITSFCRTLTDFHVLSTEIFSYYRAGSIILILILLTSFFHIKTNAFSNSLRIRRILLFLISMSAWSFALILLYGKDTDLYLAVAYLPSSVLIAYFLESISRKIRFILYYGMLLTWFAFFILRIWTF
jgi:hypothetical protein